MNQFTLLTIALLSILSGVGCHSSSGTSSTSSTVTVNGKSQEDYYAQFVDHDELDCKNKTETTVGTNTFDYNQINPPGILKRSIFNLNLFENHTYVLEQLYLEKDQNTNTLTQKEQIDYKGAWKVENGTIYLENIGHGTGLIHNDRPAINFTFDHDLSGQNLKDKSVLIFSEQRELTPEQVEAKCSK